MSWKVSFEIFQQAKEQVMMVTSVFPELSWGFRNDPQDHQPNSWDQSYLSNSEQSELC